MCIPTGGPYIDYGDGSGPAPVGSIAWGQFLGQLGEAGFGGQFGAYLLSGGGAGNEDWVAHGTSEFAQINTESGATVIVNAADLSPDVLAAYGYTYNPQDGLVSSRGPGELPAGLPDGYAWAMTSDGELVPQAEIVLPPGVTPPGMPPMAIPVVTGEVLGFVESLVDSGTLLTNRGFDDTLATYPDVRLAAGDPQQEAPQQPGAPPVPPGEIEYKFYRTDAGFVLEVPPGAPYAPNGDVIYEPGDVSDEETSTNVPSIAKPDKDAPEQTQPSLLSKLQDMYSGTPSPPPEISAEALAAELGFSGGGTPSGGQAPPNGPGGGAPGPGVGDIVVGPTGYGDGEIVVGPPGPPWSGNIEGEPVGAPTASWTDAQGLAIDGRWVPNFFKHVNKELWAAWGKYSGFDAAISFPFVAAASGAVILPQAVNDILNIPTMAWRSLDNLFKGLGSVDDVGEGRPPDYGKLSDGVVGLAETAEAALVLDEFAAGAKALSEASEVAEGARGAARGARGARRAIRQGLRQVEAAETASGGINLCADGDSFGTQASRAEPWSNGSFDVVVHGSPNGFWTQPPEVGGERISLDAVIDAIKNSGRYRKGQGVRLLSCQTGADGAIVAQELANELGDTVIAPTTDVITNANGRIWLDVNGVWREFFPK